MYMYLLEQKRLRVEGVQYSMAYSVAFKHYDAYLPMVQGFPHLHLHLNLRHFPLPQLKCPSNAQRPRTEAICTCTKPYILHKRNTTSTRLFMLQLMTAYEPDTAVQGCTFSFRHLDQSCRCISKCECSAGATSISIMQPGTNTYLIRLDIFSSFLC